MHVVEEVAAVESLHFPCPQDEQVEIAVAAVAAE